MSERTPPVLDRLRQPEYTGENRCTPCTVVNVVLAAAGSLVVGALAPPVGAVTFLAALAVIWLRGYLVPGTPTFTARYLPERVLVLFGKPQSDDRPESWDAIEKLERERSESVDPETYLREAGVVEADGEDEPGAGSGSGPAAGSTDEGDRSAASVGGSIESPREWTESNRLADDFVSAVSDRLQRADDAGSTRTRVGHLFESDPDDVEEQDRDYPAYKVGVRVRKWPSDAAMAFDLAAHEVLLEFADDWGSVPIEQRRRLLEGLRSLATDCPSCGGVIERGEEAVDSCCASGKVVTLACEGCGTRLREFSVARRGSGPMA